jgi:hypothetical protein
VFGLSGYGRRAPPPIELCEVCSPRHRCAGVSRFGGPHPELSVPGHTLGRRLLLDRRRYAYAIVTVQLVAEVWE